MQNLLKDNTKRVLIFRTISLSFVLLFYSCSNVNKSYQSDLIYCVNDKVEKKLNSTIEFFTPKDKDFSEIKINVFDSISRFEKSLIESKILSGKTKDGYKMLLKGLNDKEEFKRRIKNHNIESQFIQFLNSDDLITLIIYDSCPMEVFMKNHRNDEMKALKSIYEQMIATGFTDKKIINELIELEFFMDDYVRLSTCYLIYINSHRVEEPKMVDDKDFM